MIRVRPRVPTTARESMPKGVFCRLIARMASAMPGASRSITALVASGVTSRGASPVPPVVRIRFTWCSSLHSRSIPSINSRSSGIIAPALMMVWGICVTIARIVSPLVSWRAPAAPLSLMVNTPTVIILFLFPGRQFAHNGSNLAARAEEPDRILVGQVFYLHLALHLTREFARDDQQLPAVGLVAAKRVESQPAHALILAQNSVNDL